MAEKPFSWKFFRVGGLDQVNLESNEALSNLENLDPKLWVALSCPVKGLEFDQKTLELIDTDKDGRIRVPEIIAATKYVTERLKNPVDIVQGKDGLPISSIKDDNEQGQLLIASIKRSLAVLGKSGEPVITVADAVKAQEEIPKARFNGDGVVPESAADDDRVKSAISDSIKTVGGVSDSSGQQGVNKDKLDAFFAALAQFDEWWSAGEASAQKGSGVLPMGNDTPAAFAVFSALREKIDDYFSRCRIVEFDNRATPIMNLPDAKYTEFAPNSISPAVQEIASLPISKIEPAKPLHLIDGVNPAWAAKVTEFKTLVVSRLFGGSDSITLSDWGKIKSTFAPYEAWLGSKKGAEVQGLGIVRIRELLVSDVKARIEELIALDLEPANEVAQTANVVRLARYYRDLYRLLRNFVNFADFYDPHALSIFQAGKLYLDQRTCHLCVKVQDLGAHSSVAGLSKINLAYCNCTRPSGESMVIVAAFTQGDSDYLMVGRRGIFFDREGRDWDAVITKIIENPTSLREAVWAPYKRLAKFINDSVEKFAASKDKAAQDMATSSVSKSVEVVDQPKAAKPDGFDIAKFAGIFAAIGLAIGAIGGALGAMLTAFAKLVWWQMPLALFGIFLVISAPSVFLAWLKLRARTLGPVLEGNFWAINGRVKINIPLGTSLTTIKKLPPNSSLQLDDPFEDKAAKRRRLLFFLLILVVAAAVLVWWLDKDGYIKVFS